MNKRLVCAAVGSALAAGLSAPAAFAYHDRNILVPYVVKDSNRTTVVTLIGESYPSKTDVHLQYWTKSTTAANTAACQPSSVFVPFTPNDIMTFDTAGILGYPLFGDTTNPAALGASISYAAPRHGYLAIQFDDGSGRAYWMELDLSNGGAHGDYALNGNSGPDGAGSFVHISESQTLWPFGPGDGFDEQAPVPFWPSSVANTAFTVTPLGTAMLTKENNQVVLQVVNSNGVQGAYDRNENGGRHGAGHGALRRPPDLAAVDARGGQQRRLGGAGRLGLPCQSWRWRRKLRRVVYYLRLGSNRGRRPAGCCLPGGHEFGRWPVHVQRHSHRPAARRVLPRAVVRLRWGGGAAGRTGWS